LRWPGGAALSRDVARRWQVVTGRPLIEGYGLTEASPLVTVNRLDVIAYTGNVGLPMPSTEVTLRDDDGHAVGLGEPGEICVRGPQVMAGYWKRPDETAEVLDQDGWLRTGDIGVMDARGYVTIADRKKDVIVVSGFKVFPHEVEEVAIGHPGVLEAAAVGTPDPKSGEAVTLVVVRKDPSLSARELMDHCARLLTMYKRPRKVTFREAPLPKSATGKTLRRLLRDEPAPVPEAQSLRDASPRSWSARVGRFQNDAGWRKRLQ
jgi:long-chain acyl-CoA synthetase